MRAATIVLLRPLIFIVFSGYIQDVLYTDIAGANIGYIQDVLYTDIAGANIGYIQDVLYTDIAGANIGYIQDVLYTDIAGANIGTIISNNILLHAPAGVSFTCSTR